MSTAIASMNRDAGMAAAEDSRMLPCASTASASDSARSRRLHEVSLSIRRGEFMTLLGPSGCGKTTILNLVAGFFSPDGGEIRDRRRARE